MPSFRVKKPTNSAYDCIFCTSGKDLSHCTFPPPKEEEYSETEGGVESDIHITDGRSIIRIQVEHTGIRPIVPIAANQEGVKPSFMRLSPIMFP